MVFDILDDAKNFPDDIKFTLPGGKELTLGEVRGMSKAQQTALSEKMAAADNKLREVTELATQASSLKAQLETQLAEAGKRKEPTSDDLDTDPFWQPVSKRMKPILDTIAKMEDNQKKIASAVERAATIWAEDRWRNQFSALQPKLAKSKHKDMTFEKVRDYAAEHKLLDSYGFPSVEKAILDLTKEDELAEAIRLAKEEGIREGITRGRMASTTRPTSATGPKKPEKSVVAEKGLEGLGDDIASDPELTQMLSQLGAVDPGDLIQ